MHVPVLSAEVINYLQPQSNCNVIDCTIGGGGHSFKILPFLDPNGKILGIDLSPTAIQKIDDKRRELNLQKRIIVVNGNFAHLQEIVEQNSFSPVHGILLDLGLSSDLLESSGRGFSFMRDEPLDMRFNPEENDITAREIINQYSEKTLREIFWRYGEERYSSKIARIIVQKRKKKKINTTQELAQIIKDTLGFRFHIKSLARIFQALRISVNKELENLQQALIGSQEVLSPGGKIVVISYHSLEDRIVKIFFKRTEALRILTKKPIVPSKEEIKENSRSRSAKLRAAEKI
ncbi:16S rRNA (cytosine(1402)-N(4))-methyltransferase RsmH [Patescibacteria group bacterium]|nr:16S rRNA (cytosine(1402)-N(4))-methyltransferase RsmH [Patescibacteria group bacterium]